MSMETPNLPQGIIDLSLWNEELFMQPVTNETVTPLVVGVQMGLEARFADPDERPLSLQELRLAEISQRAEDKLFMHLKGLIHYRLTNDLGARPYDSLFDDLWQSAAESAVKAIRKADITKFHEDHPLGSFTKYISIAMWQGMTRELDNFETTIKIPVRVREAQRRVKKYGTDPMNVSLLRAASRAGRTVSLDSGRGFNTSREYTDMEGQPRLKRDPVEFLQAETPIDERIDEIFMREAVFAVLNQSNLSDRERNIIGLRVVDGLTLEDVGLRFGVTQERIRQIESRAFAKMRGGAARAGITTEYIASHPFVDTWEMPAVVDIDQPPIPQSLKADQEEQEEQRTKSPSEVLEQVTAGWVETLGRKMYAKTAVIILNRMAEKFDVLKFQGLEDEDILDGIYDWSLQDLGGDSIAAVFIAEQKELLRMETQRNEQQRELAWRRRVRETMLARVATHESIAASTRYGTDEFLEATNELNGVRNRLREIETDIELYQARHDDLLPKSCKEELEKFARNWKHGKRMLPHLLSNVERILKKTQRELTPKESN